MNRSAVNDPNKSMLYKQNLSELNLSDFKVIDPAPSKSELSKVANSLGYKPEKLDFSTPKEKAFEIQHDLRTAKSFGELDGKLSKKDLWIEKKGNQIVFTDGFTSVEAKKIGPDFKISSLNKKFGENVSKYVDARNSGLDIKGAEERVQGLFNQEIIKGLKTKRSDIKSRISEIRYELATIQTAPKQSRNIPQKKNLIEQKSNLLKKHQNLTTEIASLEKKVRISPKVDLIKSRASQVKLAADRLGGSLKAVKKGYTINKNSVKGMQSAREVIGFQKAFKNKIKSGGPDLPAKLLSIRVVAKPIIKIPYSAYRTISKAANDPELTR